jgi:hypothetical protein
LHCRAACCTAGFEWYDTTTTTILSNITFENYKYIKYVDDKEDWWYWQTPSAFRMLSHSDQFKPGGWCIHSCTAVLPAVHLFLPFRLPTIKRNCMASVMYRA